MARVVYRYLHVDTVSECTGSRVARKVRGVGFESPDIHDAVVATGLDVAQVNDFPTLVIAWSSREELLLRPEFACLSLPQVRLLRLPVTLQELRRELEFACSPVPVDPAAAPLGTAVGQWQWALERLRAAREHGAEAELEARLAELRRFALRHWPGWYEAPLARLQAIRGGPDGHAAAIHTLSDTAPWVAVLSALRGVLPGNREAERFLVSARAAHFALELAAQGRIPFAEVIEAAEDVPAPHWWRSLQPGESCEPRAPDSGHPLERELQMLHAAEAALAGDCRRWFKDSARESDPTITEMQAVCGNLRRFLGALDQLAATQDGIQKRLDAPDGDNEW